MLIFECIPDEHTLDRIPVLAGVPGVDTDEGCDEAEETLDELSLEEEEVYDDSLQPGLVDIEDGDEL